MGQTRKELDIQINETEGFGGFASVGQKTGPTERAAV
jgi:hypothetical protein